VQVDFSFNSFVVAFIGELEKKFGKTCHPGSNLLPHCLAKFMCSVVQTFSKFLKFRSNAILFICTFCSKYLWYQRY